MASFFRKFRPFRFEKALSRRHELARRARPALAQLEDRVVPSTFYEAEPNNSFTAADNVGALPVHDIVTAAHGDWLRVVGGIGSPLDTDYFQFALGAKSGVFFDLDSLDTFQSSTLDATIKVYAQD